MVLSIIHITGSILIYIRSLSILKSVEFFISSLQHASVLNTSLTDHYIFNITNKLL